MNPTQCGRVPFCLLPGNFVEKKRSEFGVIRCFYCRFTGIERNHVSHSIAAKNISKGLCARRKWRENGLAEGASFLEGDGLAVASIMRVCKLVAAAHLKRAALTLETSHLRVTVVSCC